MAAEEECKLHCALIDGKAQSSQDLDELLAQVLRFVDGHSSLLLYSNDLFCYEVNRALQQYLPPIFDGVIGRTVAFCSASKESGRDEW